MSDVEIIQPYLKTNYNETFKVTYALYCNTVLSGTYLKSKTETVTLSYFKRNIILYSYIISR